MNTSASSSHGRPPWRKCRTCATNINRTSHVPMSRTAKPMPRSSSRAARAGGTKKPIGHPSGSRTRMVTSVAATTAMSAIHCCHGNAPRARKTASQVAAKRKKEAAAEAAAEWVRPSTPLGMTELLLLPRLLDNDADVLRAVGASRVEELHGRVVIDVTGTGEKDHLRSIAVQQLADALRELIGRDVVLVDQDPVVRHETENDLVVDRGRREARGCLGRHLDQISHLHDR